MTVLADAGVVQVVCIEEPISLWIYLWLAKTNIAISSRPAKQPG
jgi:hypothetical protein